MMERRSIQAIDDAFSPLGVEAFLSSLNLRGAHIASIQEASSDLTEFIAGGPFRRGDIFITSFWEVYRTLADDARGRVDTHYSALVGAVPDALKRKYPKTFRN